MLEGLQRVRWWSSSRALQGRWALIDLIQRWTLVGEGVLFEDERYAPVPVHGHVHGHADYRWLHVRYKMISDKHGEIIRQGHRFKTLDKKGTSGQLSILPNKYYLLPRTRLPLSRRGRLLAWEHHSVYLSFHTGHEQIACMLDHHRWHTPSQDSLLSAY